MATTVYGLIENVLKDLNPNALPLDDVARANMPKLLDFGTRYRRGLLNRYEFLKAVCYVMDYDETLIKGYFVNRTDDECHGETLEVFDTYDEANTALKEYQSFDQMMDITGYGYAIVERR